MYFYGYAEDDALLKYDLEVGDSNTLCKPQIISSKFCCLYFYKSILTQYCAGDKIEKNEMGRACGAYE